MKHERTPLRATVLSLSLCLVSTATLSAQEEPGSHWLTLPVDGANVTIHSRASTLALQEPTRVLLHSGLLRRWTVVPVGANASVTAQNEHALVQDGQKIHAWSGWVGDVDTLQLSATGAMLPGPSSANYCAVAQDGKTLHAVSAYIGKWTPLTLSSAQPQVAIGRQCVLVEDGGQLYAFSAYHGTWVKGPIAAASAALTADGQVGIVDAQTFLVGFGAWSNSWALQKVTSGGSLATEAGHAVYANAAEHHFFSPYQGTWATHTAAEPKSTVASARDLSVLSNGKETWCYSAMRGTLHKSAHVGETVALGYDYALLEHAGGVSAFSGMHGTFARELPGKFTLTTSRYVAFAQHDTSGVGFAYSSVRNEWDAAPAGTIAAVKAASGSLAVSYQDGTIQAMCARESGWDVLKASSSATLKFPSRQAGTFLVEDGAKVSIHDPRFGRWTHVIQSGAKPWSTVDISFSTALVHDGEVAYGFGVNGANWDGVRIQGTSILKASSGSNTGYVLTDTHMHVWSPRGTFAVLGLYPESSGVALLGQELHCQQVTVPGAIVAMLFGTRAGELGTSIGTLYVPEPLIVLPVVAPAGGRAVQKLALPALPALIGLTLRSQSAVFSSALRPFLSNVELPILQ